MGNIVLLDDLTINKIAAGEVIERPASAVKEMLENSIDAGATNITVEIKNGGISYIRITDNGKGISEDDLEMAFERHATSKIRSADDLTVVKSMGFRGEALASIAAISRVEMVSKTAEQENGYKVVVEGGNLIEKSEAGCATGTSIIVTNLFYNTPVRYKFLRKDFTEAGYIEDAISRIALAHPEVAIKLINTGRTVIQTNGNGDLKTAIYSIYGKDVANAIIDVDYTIDDIHIYGVIGKPEIARSNRAYQIFFINKRFVKDKTLTSATEKAYKDLIPTGKFAFLVLNIDMNPSKVDVNVHPAKLEVRFEDENEIFKAVYHAIRGTLNYEDESNDVIQKSQEVLNKLMEMKQQMLGNTKIEPKVPEIKYEDKEEDKAPEIKYENKEEDKAPEIKYENKEEDKAPEIKYEDKEEYNAELNEETTEYKVLDNSILEENETEDEAQIQAEVETDNEIKSEFNAEIEDELKTEPEVEDSNQFEEMYAKMFGSKPVKEEQIEEHKQEETILEDIATTPTNVSLFDEMEEYQKINYKYIGVAFEKYVIIEIEDEMYIIDQDFARERILYEAIKNSYYSDEQTYSQLLLLPDVITLSQKQMEIVKDNVVILKKMGFIFDYFGENTIKLTEVPEMCADLETKELFLEVLKQINSVARTAQNEIEEKIIQTIASNVRANYNNNKTKEEIEDMLDKLLSLQQPFEIKDGKNVAIKMSKYDIERKFARK